MSDIDKDQIKGRAKQALGDLTDDEKLKREGRADERAGKAKQAVDEGAEKLREGIDAVKSKLRRD